MLKLSRNPSKVIEILNLNIITASDREHMGHWYLLGYRLICVYDMVINSSLLVVFCLVSPMKKKQFGTVKSMSLTA